MADEYDEFITQDNSRAFLSWPDFLADPSRENLVRCVDRRKEAKSRFERHAAAWFMAALETLKTRAKLTREEGFPDEKLEKFNAMLEKVG